MANPIVTVNVNQIVAPAPSTLQGSGAFISQGATILSYGLKALLTQIGDLTAILKGALALSSLTWSGSVVTATTAAPHGFSNADVIELTISGATPSGYNGTVPCTITGPSAFTYPLASNPGSETVPGVYTPEDVAELVAMNNTFFSQGGQKSVWVLELGAGSAADGVTALSTWISANPPTFYSYLVPRPWADEATFRSFAASFVAPNKRTYFYTTMTNANYTSFPASLKSVKGMIEAPSGLPVNEFSHAADFQHDLSYAPSSTNKVTPNAYAYLFDVTQFPTFNNSALITAYQGANVNIVGPGSEAGITNDILLWGTTMDGNDFTYWYSVDWVQINVDLDVSNEIVNGSNNPVNPLYYNQDGINRLQARASGTLNNGVSFGLVLGQVVQTQLSSDDLNKALDAGTFGTSTIVNAIPFVPYSVLNPNDYAQGVYNGFVISYIPARGFKRVTFNLNVSNFVTQ